MSLTLGIGRSFRRSSASGTPVTTQIALTPSSLSISPGDTGFIVGVAETAGGTPTGATVTYTSSDINILTVNSSTGAYTGVAAGSATITATAGAITATASVTVQTLAQRIATAAGGDANVYMYLFGHGETLSGSRLTAWQDARGGAYPTFAEVSSSGPTKGTSRYTFAGSQYLTCATSLFTDIDNVAIISVRALERTENDGNQIVASLGGGFGGGFSMTTSTAVVGPTTGLQNSVGGLLHGVAWVGSSIHLGNGDEAADVTNLSQTILEDQVFRRLSGSSSTLVRGNNFGVEVTNTPSAPSGNSYIGWNGAHDKLKGDVVATIYLKNVTSDAQIESICALLRTAYGTPAWRMSFTAPTTGWIDLATSMPSSGTIGSWTAATALEGNTPTITSTLPLAHPDGFTQAGLIDYLITTADGVNTQDRNTGFDAVFSQSVTPRYMLEIDYSLLFDPSVTMSDNGSARKTMYIDGSSVNPFFIVGGTAGILDCTTASPAVQRGGSNVVRFDYGTSHIWYRHVVHMALESSIGALDGYFNLTINGTLCHQNFNVQNSDDVSTSLTQLLKTVRMGQQYDQLANGHEARYIIIHTCRMALIAGR